MGYRLRQYCSFLCRVIGEGCNIYMIINKVYKYKHIAYV